MIDDATIKLMENPRCGNSDFEQNGGSKSHGFTNGTAKVRKKRFSILRKYSICNKAEHNLKTRLHYH